MKFLERYRRARRWRTCPKCYGAGVDVIDTILVNNFHPRPCSLCDGKGTIRYTRWTAFTAARLGLVNHPLDHYTRVD